MSAKEVIRKRMTWMGISFRTLSDRTGINYNNLYASLSDKRNRPLKADEFICICKFLELNLSDFHNPQDKEE